MRNQQAQIGDVRVGQVYERVGKGTTCRVVAVNSEPYPHAIVETVGGPSAGRRTTRSDMGGLRLVVEKPTDAEHFAAVAANASVLPFDGIQVSAEEALKREVAGLREDIVALRKTVWSAIHAAERWADNEAKLARRTL